MNTPRRRRHLRSLVYYSMMRLDRYSLPSSLYKYTGFLNAMVLPIVGFLNAVGGVTLSIQVVRARLQGDFRSQTAACSYTYYMKEGILFYIAQTTHISS